jgi:hypothetical protein
VRLEGKSGTSGRWRLLAVGCSADRGEKKEEEEEEEEGKEEGTWTGWIAAGREIGRGLLEDESGAEDETEIGPTSSLDSMLWVEEDDGATFALASAARL